MNGQDIIGIGIRVPGTVKDNQIVWVPSVSYLDGANVVKVLKEKYNIETFIANDAQLSLLGESWKGSAYQKEHAVLISVGTGIGGAIMQNSKIVQGVNGGAGALGWIHLDLNEPSSANHGYLELHASGTAIMKMGSKLIPPLTSHQVMEKARKGNEECLKIVHNVAHKLGTALAIVSSILEPELIIFSGGISDAFDLIEGTMNASLERYLSVGT